MKAGEKRRFFMWDFFFDTANEGLGARVLSGKYNTHVRSALGVGNDRHVSLVSVM